MSWRVYRGVKRSTKQKAAIFAFDKKIVDNWPKEDRDALLDTLRKGVTQLTKLRHPRILTLNHPLEESRDTIAFATEPIIASLANLLGNLQNTPSGFSTYCKEYELFEVEKKIGIIQIAEGLTFLHSEVKLLHRNISPESIIINSEGVWKISGFEYCLLNQNPSGATPHWAYIEYMSTWHPLTQPSLEYAAPELVHSTTSTTKSDIYSFAVLIYAMYSPGGKPIKTFAKDYASFKKFTNDLKRGSYPNLSCIPDELREHVKQMLQFDPDVRSTTHDIAKVRSMGIEKKKLSTKLSIISSKLLLTFVSPYTTFLLTI